MKFPEFPPPDPHPVKLPQYVLMNKWGEPFSHVAEQSSSSATCELPHRAVAVLRPKCLILSTEHCARGVSWPSTAVYGAPAAGGMEMEQTWRPNPGYRWVICANQHILVYYVHSCTLRTFLYDWIGRLPASRFPQQMQENYLVRWRKTLWFRLKLLPYVRHLSYIMYVMSVYYV